MKYNVTLNGTDYEVLLDDGFAELTGSAPSRRETTIAPAITPAPSAVSGGQVVNAPIPGAIIKVAVSVGDAVKANQVLLILEAMKMENEIMAPCAGVVTGIFVQKGAVVETGAALVSIG